jgi:hypothetical protein
MGWASFWAILSQTHPVTLLPKCCSDLGVDNHRCSNLHTVKAVLKNIYFGIYFTHMHTVKGFVKIYISAFIPPTCTQINYFFFWWGDPCASPPPWPSILSDYSFPVHHSANRDDRHLLANAMASGTRINLQVIALQCINS